MEISACFYHPIIPLTPPHICLSHFFPSFTFSGMPLNVFRVSQNVCHLIFFSPTGTILGNIGLFLPPHHNPLQPPISVLAVFLPSLTFSGMPLNVFMVPQNVCHSIFFLPRVLLLEISAYFYHPVITPPYFS